MITASVSRSWQRAAALVLSALMIVALVVAAPQKASAGPRGWLRPDATGTCQWDRAKYWVQRCDVWSHAAGRNITVQIQPAARGGNAGYYLLDGLRATNDSSAWLTQVNAARTYNNSNITLVMPVGGAGSFYADWRGPATFDVKNPVNYKWETFLTKELPVYLEKHFGVARNNNAIGGLSMGGTAAVNIGTKHPEQFRQMLSFSGYLTTTMPGADTLMRVALLDAGGFNINNMYGSIIGSARYENDPFLNMHQLGGRPVYVSAGTGFPGPKDAGIPFEHALPGILLEIVSNLSTRAWGLKAVAEGRNVTQYYAPSGIHNWNRFGSELNRTKPIVLDYMNAW